MLKTIICSGLYNALHEMQCEINVYIKLNFCEVINYMIYSARCRFVTVCWCDMLKKSCTVWHSYGEVTSWLRIPNWYSCLAANCLPNLSLLNVNYKKFTFTLQRYSLCLNFRKVFVTTRFCRHHTSHKLSVISLTGVIWGTRWCTVPDIGLYYNLWVFL